MKVRGVASSSRYSRSHLFPPVVDDAAHDRGARRDANARANDNRRVVAEDVLRGRAVWPVDVEEWLAVGARDLSERDAAGGGVARDEFDGAGVGGVVCERDRERGVESAERRRGHQCDETLAEVFAARDVAGGREVVVARQRVRRTELQVGRHLISPRVLGWVDADVDL